jgi:glutamate synthase domain-containing protein 2
VTDPCGRESAADLCKTDTPSAQNRGIAGNHVFAAWRGNADAYLLLPFTPRYILLTISLHAAVAALDPETLPALSLPLAVVGGLVVLGICDLIQTRHAILRNYPIAAHIRFILEHVRPELRQYFFEAEKDGTPFPGDKRALVYQRAKQQLDTRPFGTHYDVYRDHYEWLHHSIQPKEPASEIVRTTIGGAECTKPYSASVFNISAMSRRAPVRHNPFQPKGGLGGGLAGELCAARRLRAGKHHARRRVRRGRGQLLRKPEIASAMLFGGLPRRCWRTTRGGMRSTGAATSSTIGGNGS